MKVVMVLIEHGADVNVMCRDSHGDKVCVGYG